MYGLPNRLNKSCRRCVLAPGTQLAPGAERGGSCGTLLSSLKVTGVVFEQTTRARLTLSPPRPTQSRRLKKREQGARACESSADSAQVLSGVFSSGAPYDTLTHYSASSCVACV